MVHPIGPPTMAMVTFTTGRQHPANTPPPNSSLDCVCSGYALLPVHHGMGWTGLGREQLAKTEGYDLASITGTGPGGRIIAADVKEFVPAFADAKSEVRNDI